MEQREQRGRRDGAAPQQENEFDERLVFINRCSKVVKGGRRFSFSAVVVVGDREGRVGFGFGKANEVSEAIRKGLEDAKKHIVNVTLEGSTIPHEVIGEAGAGRVLLMPAPEGTGVLAGGAARAVLEAAGIKNIRAKCLRSHNPANVVAATVTGLKTLRNAEQVSLYRGKAAAEIKG